MKLTNEQLKKQNKEMTTTGEILRFIGVNILIAGFEFSARRDLWATTSKHKYIPAPNFGTTGLHRHRYDHLFKCTRFSNQPGEKPSGMSHSKWRWMLVDDFVRNFNDHREKYFEPGSTICADESISRWYGLGGDWINVGLPFYVAIDRKPENGCEIQDAACGKSGVMIRLRIVKSANDHDEVEDSTFMHEDGLLHGTKVLIDLISPWANTDRVVCADSYFASKMAADKLKEIGLRFIGVVKTATRGFPMAYLSKIELCERGEKEGVITYDENGIANSMAFVWMDRDRRYFISTCSSLNDGKPYERSRWRQINNSADANAERVSLLVPQPKACELYYDTCAAVDKHNRHRQDTLKLEKKVETHSWDKRVNFSILGICIVDTWLAYQLATNTKTPQRDFYMDLAEELIDNNYDGSNTRRHINLNNEQVSPTLRSKRDGTMRSGVCAHLTPTKKRRIANKKVTNQCKQGYCAVCRKKTKYNCSLCIDLNPNTENELFLCHTETGRECFMTHLQKCHDF